MRTVTLVRSRWQRRVASSDIQMPRPPSTAIRSPWRAVGRDTGCVTITSRDPSLNMKFRWDIP
eukprot:scaffold29586_cov48-Attheya_sp.AAC.4